MWALLELEEQIGRCWHRFLGQGASYPCYPEAAVTLDSLQAALSVFFRGMGGAPGLTLASGMPRASGHRLRLRQRFGLEREVLSITECNSERILLPAAIAYFPSAALNRRLYFWLAAFFALGRDGDYVHPCDPLQADLAFLHQAYGISQQVCRRYRGLRQDYHALCAAVREMRPPRSLPLQEQAVEEAILALLGAPCVTSQGKALLAIITCPQLDLNKWQASSRYRSFLPVPLWGEISQLAKPQSAPPPSSEEIEGGGQDAADSRRRQAKRRRYEQSERNDPLLLNRFEKLLSWAEMVNINRGVEDEEETAARAVAETMDELALAPHQRRAATKLKFDLDLAPGDIEPSLLIAELAYPEWDYRRKVYHHDHCVVRSQLATEEGEQWVPDTSAKRRIRRIRRHFEALRPKREVLRRQLDGAELDMDALVRAHCDVVASGRGSDRVYLMARQQARDLAVAILVDVSLSTDSWVDNRRVLDVEKEALTAFACGLAACGDAFAIYTFTSRKRHFVQVATVKDFAASLSDQVLRRIAALRPGYYTRMGAALRHVQQQLARRPERHRLLLLISDGKPNDLDYYEGRYGIEDTRQAILEARQAGLTVFGITVDRRAQNYFPYLFGRSGYAIVSRLERLPQVLPSLYQQWIG